MEFVPRNITSQLFRVFSRQQKIVWKPSSEDESSDVVKEDENSEENIAELKTGDGPKLNYIYFNIFLVTFLLTLTFIYCSCFIWVYKVSSEFNNCLKGPEQ